MQNYSQSSKNNNSTLTNSQRKILTDLKSNIPFRIKKALSRIHTVYQSDPNISMYMNECIRLASIDQKKYNFTEDESKDINGALYYLLARSDNYTHLLLINTLLQKTKPKLGFDLGDDKDIVYVYEVLKKVREKEILDFFLKELTEPFIFPYVYNLSKQMFLDHKFREILCKNIANVDSELDVYLQSIYYISYIDEQILTLKEVLVNLELCLRLYKSVRTYEYAPKAIVALLRMLLYRRYKENSVMFKTPFSNNDKNDNDKKEHEGSTSNNNINNNINNNKINERSINNSNTSNNNINDITIGIGNMDISGRNIEDINNNNPNNEELEKIKNNIYNSAEEYNGISESEDFLLNDSKDNFINKRNNKQEYINETDTNQTNDSINYKIPLSLIKNISHLIQLRDKAQEKISLPVMKSNKPKLSYSEKIHSILIEIASTADPIIVYFSIKLLYHLSLIEQKHITTLTMFLDKDEHISYPFMTLIKDIITNIKPKENNKKNNNFILSNRFFAFKSTDNIRIFKIKIQLLLILFNEYARKEIEYGLKIYPFIALEYIIKDHITNNKPDNTINTGTSYILKKAIEYCSSKNKNKTYEILFTYENNTKIYNIIKNIINKEEYNNKHKEQPPTNNNNHPHIVLLANMVNKIPDTSHLSTEEKIYLYLVLYNRKIINKDYIMRYIEELSVDHKEKYKYIISYINNDNNNDDSKECGDKEGDINNDGKDCDLNNNDIINNNKKDDGKESDINNNNK
ncbi:hypothetical protein SLOPH_996 [Spraguea lophii 42_110]|uniref:Uncharacterized protein n=1 Tax=Spraguea lophii (strain 42_110) TaxID=1358809 RepID=S7W7R2_SPRLO|nr:hypothetical protein SLOPH_996 [Spraguea lophii 42_110]